MNALIDLRHFKQERDYAMAMPGDLTDHDETRLRVLRLLETEPNLSQREMAESLGISLGGINYCLKALVEKGWLKMERFRRSENKLRYAYLLTPKGAKAKTRLAKGFLHRKLVEYEALQSEIKELETELGVE